MKDRNLFRKNKYIVLYEIKYLYHTHNDYLFTKSKSNIDNQIIDLARSIITHKLCDTDGYSINGVINISKMTFINDTIIPGLLNRLKYGKVDASDYINLRLLKNGRI